MFTLLSQNCERPIERYLMNNLFHYLPMELLPGLIAVPLLATGFAGLVALWILLKIVLRETSRYLRRIISRPGTFFFVPTAQRPSRPDVSQRQGILIASRAPR
jgi:hypothetical protein